ncbi:NAD-dependent epimerase/dehydratase family protein [Candidatus Chloroploca asiatica]|uniref:NAD-dependent dehydratase n=1 Tax=Candidatus Chloroploca asiatica TaxID=1506545 RepID=A0A2H3KIB9_9CHLR|nr:NAD-dependent epimerase/dehydratase family protein [Candidatus Chloroploca asiatica]PDV97568.1 NAD-dependent dehydratase [Candidatus Chloroploca asiatica]
MNIATTHVIFGTGPLGRAVMNELIRRGKQIRMVSRSGQMAEIPEGVAIVAGDLYNADCVREVTRDAAVVYQCAQPHYWAWPEKFPPLQAAIIAGLTGSQARLVIGDNTYMYGDTRGQPLTEDLPYAARTRKGKTRAAMSQAALEAHTTGKVAVSIGRGSDFFGPWVTDSTFGARVFYPALEGKAASFVGKLDLPHTATYIEDFGRALVILGEHDEALGKAWHVPSDRPEMTQRQFAQLLYYTVGHPIKVSGVSKPMMALAGLFIPGARETVEMMYEFEQPFVVDANRFAQTFAMQATPLAEAMEATVAWYRMHPQLR